MSTTEILLVAATLAVGLTGGFFIQKFFAAKKALRFSLKSLKEFDPTEITKKLEISVGGKTLTNLVVLQLEVENVGNRDLILQVEEKGTGALRPLPEVVTMPHFSYSGFEYIDCTTVNNDPNRFYVSLGAAPSTTYINIKFIKKRACAIIHIYATVTEPGRNFDSDMITSFRGAIGDTTLEGKDLLAKRR